MRTQVLLAFATLLIGTQATTCNFENQGLTEFPEPSTIAGCTTLNFTGNSIGAVPGDALETVPGLTTLILRGNPIGSLPDGLFRHTPDVLQLDLDSTGLEFIQDGLLEPLSKLQGLWLSRDTFTELTDSTLRGLSSLQLLTASFGSLQRIAPDALKHFPNLTFLSLRENPLQTLPERVFEGVPLIEELRLANTALTELPSSLGDLPLVTDAFFSDSRMTTVDLSALATCPALKHLWLQNNHLQDDGVVNSQSVPLANITHVGLHANNFTAIPEAVMELPGLQEVWFQHQRVELDGNRVAEQVKQLQQRGVRVLHDCIYGDNEVVSEEVAADGEVEADGDLTLEVSLRQTLLLTATSPDPMPCPSSRTVSAVDLPRIWDDCTVHMHDIHVQPLVDVEDGAPLRRKLPSSDKGSRGWSSATATATAWVVVMLGIFVFFV